MYCYEFFHDQAEDRPIPSGVIACFRRIVRRSGPVRTGCPEQVLPRPPTVADGRSPPERCCTGAPRPFLRAKGGSPVPETGGGVGTRPSRVPRLSSGLGG